MRCTRREKKHCHELTRSLLHVCFPAPGRNTHRPGLPLAPVPDGATRTQAPPKAGVPAGRATTCPRFMVSLPNRTGSARTFGGMCACARTFSFFFAVVDCAKKRKRATDQRMSGHPLFAAAASPPRRFGAETVTTVDAEYARLVGVIDAFVQHEIRAIRRRTEDYLAFRVTDATV